MREDIRNWMIDALTFDRQHYEDRAGCCRLTTLAEDAHGDLATFTEEIPEVYFEEAMTAAEHIGGFND